MKSKGLLVVLSVLIGSSSALARSSAFMVPMDPKEYQTAEKDFAEGRLTTLSDLQGNWEQDLYIENYNYVPHRIGEVEEVSVQNNPGLPYSVKELRRREAKSGIRGLQVDAKKAPVLKFEPDFIKFSDYSGAGRNIPDRVTLSGDGKWLSYYFHSFSPGSEDTINGSCVLQAQDDRVLICRETIKASSVDAKVDDAIAYRVYHRLR